MPLTRALPRASAQERARARPSRLSAWVTAASLAGAALAVTPTARAQPHDKAAAEALFTEGLRLMDAKNYAEACPKFAASYQVDQATGTLLNLAECHARSGKTASAWAEFREAASLAQKQHDTARLKKAQRRANALERKLSRLQVAVSAPAADLTVTRDGATLDPGAWGSDLPVDPGTHTIEATAPGKRAWKTTVEVASTSQVTKILVPALEPEPAHAEKSTSSPSAGKGASGDADHAPPSGAPVSSGAPGGSDAPAQGGLPGQRIAALAIAAVGLGGIAVGSVFGVKAMTAWRSALDGHCTADYQCDQEGVDLHDQAIAASRISTPAFIAGGALVAGGIILWATTPRAAQRRPSTGFTVLPSGGPQGFGLTMRGRF